MIWLELWLLPASNLSAVYEIVDETYPDTVHHFLYEDWFPDGAVVRVGSRFRFASEELIERRGELETLGVERIHRWDSGPDEKKFGDAWPDVYRFFEATSRLSLHNLDRRTLHKVTHCHLNAHGLDVPDEVEWAKAFAKERAKMEKVVQKANREKVTPTEIIQREGATA